MATIELKGMDELIRGLNELEKEQLPFAIAKSLTDIAWIAKGDTVTEMKSVLDRPTPFTLNSLEVKRATKTNLQSRVWFKSPSRTNNLPHYLTAQVEGGRRHFKKFEAALNKIGVLPSGYYTTPASGADIDSYGNMKKGQIIQIMSYFAAFGEHGYTANMTEERRKKLWQGTKKRGGFAYFAVQPGGQGGLKPGIYKRIHSSFGNAVKPVLLFNRAVSYREKLNLQEVANATYDRHFMDKFSQNLTAALNSAIPKR